MSEPIRLVVLGDVADWNMTSFEVGRIPEVYWRTIAEADLLIANLEGPIRTTDAPLPSRPRLSPRRSVDRALASIIDAFGKPQPNAVHYLQYDDDGYLHRYLEFWASGSELRLRAVYVVQAKDQYRDVTKYWFSDKGKFSEKYVHTDKAAFSQSRKETELKRTRSRPYPSYNDRPLSYGMKTLLPVPEK